MEIRKIKTLLLSIMGVVALSSSSVMAQENVCNTVEFRLVMKENIDHVLQPHGIKAVDLYNFKTIKFDRVKQEAICEGTAQWNDMSVEKIRFSTYKNSMGENLVKVEAI